MAPGPVMGFVVAKEVFSLLVALPETYNSSHLKMDAWNTIVSFWDGLFLRGENVRF